MKKILCFFLFLILINTTLTLAKSEDITLTLNQKEYYFKIGAPAIIPLETENTYTKNISGQLTSTLTQSTNQPGISQSSTSSNSIPMMITTGKNQIQLNFGTSSQPTTLDISLSFQYFEQESKAVNLDNLKIHIIQDDPKNQNKQNKQSSSSQSQASQQQKQLQQQMKQIQNQQQQTSQKLTNSQSHQDSSALKKQLEAQNQQLQAQKKLMKKTLEQNKRIQQEHKKMLDKGYKLSNMEMNPDKNNSGNFKMSYKKENGDKAQISGRINKNKIENLQTNSEEEKQQALKKLQENKDFQKIQKKLSKEKFSPTKTSVKKINNKTQIKIQYTNEKNQTATTTATIKNQTIENVKLEKENSSNTNYLTIIIIILILIATGFIIYKRYQKKKELQNIQTPTPTKPKPYNYKLVSRKLLTKSKKLFQEKKYKDAYESASQAIRIFLSYSNGLKKETTSDEIIRHLKTKNIKTSKLKNTLDTCSMVEFAKYSPNKSDFNKIISFAETLIK